MVSAAVPPKVLPSRVQVARHARLTAEQAGHLRHFHNLATARDGEWPHMGAQEPMQEFLDAYRYQLATMVYATATAHYHRLPALRTALKSLMRRLIRKMLRREVWGYWFLTSHSGTRVDPDLKELRRPWADPVARENIMYSGHLLLMTSLYAVLFDDDEFERAGSLTFDWSPMFWGMGPEVFPYSNRSIQAAVLAEMERNGWAGVCCEPNLIFVVCNQFPLLALRYNDLRDGTHVFADVSARYEAALLRKGMISQEAYFADALALRRDIVGPATDVAFTAWAGAYMNAWKPDFVRAAFDAHVAGTVTSTATATSGTGSGKEVRIHDARLAAIMRRLAADDPAGLPLDSRANIDAAKAEFRALPPPKFPYTKPTLGLVLQWLSELGKEELLSGLLEYCDRRLDPTWERGGLYYPRNDEPLAVDGSCDWTFMDPFTGNASIAYARLNVEDGQRHMFERPPTPAALAAAPHVDGLDLGDGLDVLRAVWDDDAAAMLVTVRPWRAHAAAVARFTVRNLPAHINATTTKDDAGEWTVFVDGVEHRSSGEAGAAAKNEVAVSVEAPPGRDTDIVVCRAGAAA